MVKNKGKTKGMEHPRMLAKNERSCAHGESGQSQGGKGKKRENVSKQERLENGEGGYVVWRRVMLNGGSGGDRKSTKMGKYFNISSQQGNKALFRD